MENILFKEEMQENDKYTIESDISSLELMERAGQAFFNDFKNRIDKNSSILMVVNSGGNGCDGLVLARLLYENDFNVNIYLISNKGRDEFEINLKKYKGKYS